MKHNRILSLPAFALALLASVATGCSGINASKSVSPIDFLLPGLMENRPSPPATPLQTNIVSLLAPDPGRTAGLNQ
jgi:hypothetical protein